MKRLLTLLALAAALTAPAQIKVVKLWDNATAPHSNGAAGPETEKKGAVYNTVDTELFIYPAAGDKATGQGVVVCPGGGYRFVSMQREGYEVGEWLAANGITAVALKYRLPNGRCEVPLEDTAAALRYLRDYAEEYGVDPSRVGVMGFSAGGHLAASAATMLPEAVRPAFAVLIYPVITAEPDKCHKGSFDHLLGTERTVEAEAQWSLQNRVTATTPPTLLLLTDDDSTVPPVNSTLFYEALKRNGVKGCSLRIYPSGGHGGGFNPDRIYRTTWRTDVLDWLATLPNNAAHILTPPAPATPRINGARIFGARPDSRFFFTIPATGQRPITFTAEGLPKGLKLDPRSGRITGRVKKAGEYTVRLTATNALGSDVRDLRIVIGDRLALTPPMGWNSWNCWGHDVTQEDIQAAADAFVKYDLVNYGWTYVNVDVAWQGLRGGKYNAIQTNKAFPDMQALADDIHAKGLRFGLYSTPWVGTYRGHIGSSADHADGTYDHVAEGLCNDRWRFANTDTRNYSENFRHSPYSFVRNDVQQWNDWGIDYLKYDWNPVDEWHTVEMRNALRALDRDVVYSLTNTCPFADAPLWNRTAEMWRNKGDIRDNWKSMSEIGFGVTRCAPFSGPGSWHDPDMLVIGKVGWGHDKLHYTRLTPDEQYTHLSLWALLGAPLLLGCDLTNLDPFTLSLITNNEVIAVDQDPLGCQAVPFWTSVSGNETIYVKPLEDGSIAVGLFNRGEKPAKIGFKPIALGLWGEKTIRDLWRQKDLGAFADDQRYETTVAPHGVVLLKVYPGNSRERANGGR